MQAAAELDAPLVEASRRGDHAAFAQIIERYQRGVYAVAFSGLRDRALADDVTQDTFVIAWQRLHELRDIGRLPAWLCGIARNLARDTRKRVRRETKVELDDVVHATTPFDVMSEVESERILAAALGQVPDIYREPLVLYYYEERSIGDVARCLGISAATTNKRLSRARRYLAERVTAVEHGLARRGSRPGLAASVLALIGVTAPASHVDASPAVAKGSTMHKLTIAAVVTASLAGAGFLVATAARGAHAKTPAPHEPESESRPTVAAARTPATRHTAPPARAGSNCLPSLSSLFGGGAASTNAHASASTDCDAIGRHLADLEADATHDAANPRDESSHEACATYYIAQCNREGWSEERRTCTLAAADVINAHLCAGRTPAAPAADAPSALPEALSCAPLSTHMAATLHAAGLFTEVADLPQQVEAACDLGTWSLELRQCFAAAATVDALQACL